LPGHYRSAEGSDGEGVVMTDRPPTRQRDSNPVPSQEDGLLDLLRKAEGYAYALAHGTISEATQIEPMGSWPWESGYAIQQRTQAI
jgi:hypothetical protein